MLIIAVAGSVLVFSEGSSNDISTHVNSFSTITGRVIIGELLNCPLDITDTDNGDIFTRGITSYYGCLPVFKEDTCLSPCQLIEYAGAESTVFNCTNGCVIDACLQTPDINPRLSTYCANYIYTPPINNTNNTNNNVSSKPIIDMSVNEIYNNQEGGLYGNGMNTPPTLHKQAALTELSKIKPLDANGNPSSNGKIGVISVGMSNTRMIWSTFIETIAANYGINTDIGYLDQTGHQVLYLPMTNAVGVINPDLVFVNGAQSGQDALAWATKNGVWSTLASYVNSAGLSNSQVQVAWLMEANAQPNGTFPSDANLYHDRVKIIIQRLKTEYPNLKIIYLSSREYAGYATITLNPEPYAYEYGFATRWLIQEQINNDSTLNYNSNAGPVKAPLLLWGPYTWADGINPRSDGLFYTREDFSPDDGTHPASPGAQEKIANLLINYFQNNELAKSWYTGSGINNTNNTNNTSNTNTTVLKDSLEFGVNVPFTDPVLRTIIADPTAYSNYSVILNKYNIVHYRYPGGIPVRYYFWDRSDLIHTATYKIGDFYEQIGNLDEATNYHRFNYSVDPNNYEQFLNFVNAVGGKPIIQLNTLFYVDNGQVYQTEPFFQSEIFVTVIPLQSDRWYRIEKYLEEQMLFTHNIISEDITWEIGNEDNALLNAPTYGYIVSKYTDIIKSRYPNDKVIVQMTPGDFKKERKGQWNDDLIAYLVSNYSLDKIDYFAPHYYYNATQPYPNQAAINERIQNSAADDYFASVLASFPVGYNPKLSITEFEAALHPEYNNFTNSQIHAIIFLDTLFKFYKNPQTVSATKHAFTPMKSGMFYDRVDYKDLLYYDPLRQDTDMFEYVPPRTDATRLFYDDVKGTFVDYKITSAYEMLVTKYAGNNIVAILNYENFPSQVDISSYYVNNTNPKIYNTYVFDQINFNYDARSFYWDIANNTVRGNAGSIITVPAHSFTIVKNS